MKSLFGFLLVFFSLQSCGQSSNPVQPQQTIRVGGGCEGCEAIFESPVALNELGWQDTLADYNEAGPKLHIAGTVYNADGRTPAPGVVLYVYHTDQNGIYPKRGDEKGWAARHGYLRSWIKTDAQGRYAFHTLKPASYPQATEPTHIHVIVKEPNRNEYYMDDFVFDDDPFLNASHRQRLQNKGGSGILKPSKQNGVLTAKRDIVLGKNIEDYK